jgi:hypothetical protein
VRAAIIAGDGEADATATVGDGEGATVSPVPDVQATASDPIIRSEMLSITLFI